MGIVSQDSHDHRDVQNRRTLATQLKGLFVLLLLVVVVVGATQGTEILTTVWAGAGCYYLNAPLNISHTLVFCQHARLKSKL